MNLPPWQGEAPGRLDVLGGVADYSGSLVLQMPIRAKTCVTISPRTSPGLEFSSDNEGTVTSALAGATRSRLTERRSRFPARLARRASGAALGALPARLLALVLPRPGLAAAGRAELRHHLGGPDLDGGQQQRGAGGGHAPRPRSGLGPALHRHRPVTAGSAGGERGRGGAVRAHGPARGLARRSRRPAADLVPARHPGRTGAAARGGGRRRLAQRRQARRVGLALRNGTGGVIHGQEDPGG